MTYKWKELAQELLFIAQAGLTYSKDQYDLERFERIKELSAEIMSDFTDTDLPKIKGLFDNENGFMTPKVDVRGVVLKKGKVLLVKEENNGLWSLPGGWADVGLSAAENVEKEVWEEAGIKVKADRLLAVWDKKMHNHPPSPWYTYKVILHCQWLKGELKTGMETTDCGFFGLGDLPPLSTDRNTEDQVKRAVELALNLSLPPDFD